MLGDNRSVITSATLPHSLLNKRHNALAYHRVCEAIAAKIFDFYWIDSKVNKADILSKHWEAATVYPMIQAMFDLHGPLKWSHKDSPLK